MMAKCYLDVSLALQSENKFRQMGYSAASNPMNPPDCRPQKLA